MEESYHYYPERVYIYGLVDPRSGKMFYVGQTLYPDSRLGQHCSEPIQLKYVADMVRNEIYPVMKVLCFTHGKASATELETKVISWFRNAGFPLVNQDRSKYLPPGKRRKVRPTHIVLSDVEGPQKNLPRPVRAVKIRNTADRSKAEQMFDAWLNAT